MPSLFRSLIAFTLGALLLALPAAAGVATGAQTRALWDRVAPPTTRGDVEAERFRSFALDVEGLADVLRAAPREGRGGGPLVVALPAPGGEFQRFALEESPVMEPGLAQEHPEIRTYAGQGLDDPAATIRADVSPLGFHASVRSPNGAWYVDPYSRRDDDVHVSYYGRDLENPRGPLVEYEEIEEPDAHEHDEHEADGAARGSGPAVSLRTYRLALVSDPTYATYHGSANVTAAKVALVNRVTQIYEDETAIRLVLADGNDALNLNTTADATGANGPCGGGPCFLSGQLDSCSGALLTRTHIVIGRLLGASNYDVGHIVLGKNGGGIAGLGVVGGTGKGRGCTGLPQPVGDFFAVDYVAHELGHQFNAHHTFNGTLGNCSGPNRSQPDSVEPGSGSSIMAYAGICGSDDLQPHTDPYWSQRSRAVIQSYVSSGVFSIPEVQTVWLAGFDGTDSFRLRFDGSDSALVTRGTNYTTSGIKAAIEGISGWPAGVTVTIAGFAGGVLDDTGFRVTFSGTVDRPPLEVVGATGVTGSVGETDRGGPVTHGGTVSPTGNNAPDVTAPGPATIPKQTPFALTASGTDPDGDPLTYLWEQNDPGIGSGIALQNNTKANGPLFRVFGTPLQKPPYVPTQYNSPGSNAPTADPTRVFPDLAQILAGNTNAATGTCSNVTCFSEFLPTADYLGAGSLRQLNFRVTARDGRAGGGGVATANTVLTVAPLAGPFLVTAPSTSATRAGDSELTVEWDVAGTNVAPVSTSHVRIALSVDGGLTYPHELAASTPNDGEETVILPNVSAAAARIKVEAVGNVYFDVNDVSFPLVQDNGPDTVIESGPSGLTNDPTPTFTFRSEPDGLPFECRVDAAAFAPCTSPHTTAPLADGLRTFEVRSKDGGDVDLTPASRSFIVDTTPPVTTIDSGPSGPMNDPTPTFAFSSEPGATFECRVDDASFAACDSPHTTAVLAEGGHTFEVRAQDEVGNVEPTPAARSFTVDTTPPATTILSGPTGTTANKTPTFGFSSDEPGATFQCRVDAGAFAPCTSPHTTKALAPGAHTFRARAIDEAGNVGAAASRSFTYAPPLQTTLGKRTINQARRLATFRFSGSGGLGKRTFQCRLTGPKTTKGQRAWSKCASPRKYRKLKPGSYAFHVRSRDATGAVDKTPAKSAFKIRRR